MNYEKIAQRVFTVRDQELFARLSSDVNPMHMDNLAARRTQAGSQVVHGVHAFLWALESWFAHNQGRRTIVSAKTKFNKFLLLEKPVAVFITKYNDKSTRLSLTCDDLEVMTVTLKFGEPKSAPLASEFVELADKPTGDSPDVRTFVEMDSVSGWLNPPADATDISSAFLNCCAALSARRVAAIGQLSTLVGMHNPGLHSVFSSFAIELVGMQADRAGLGFFTERADERFRMVVLKVAGSGVQGTVETFARQEPVAAPTVDLLRKQVAPDEFSSVNALIIGGSRGLGAATAKLIAAGGGRCVVTYSRGQQDAEAVAAELNEACGADTCMAMRYDATESAASQLLDSLGELTQLYYFATPQIFRQKTDFSATELQDFMAIYVSGFQDICSTLLQKNEATLKSVFYPSSVAVDERPKGMLEYAMAKVAGEMLCKDLGQAHDGLNIHVSRIPRTTTDQTATVSPVESADPVDIMLPIIRDMS